MSFLTSLFVSFANHHCPNPPVNNALSAAADNQAPADRTWPTQTKSSWKKIA